MFDTFQVYVWGVSQIGPPYLTIGRSLGRNILDYCMGHQALICYGVKFKIR
jgi:hypothetical protein